MGSIRFLSESDHEEETVHGRPSEDHGTRNDSLNLSLCFNLQSVNKLENRAFTSRFPRQRRYIQSVVFVDAPNRVSRLTIGGFVFSKSWVVGANCARDEVTI